MERTAMAAWQKMQGSLHEISYCRKQTLQYIAEIMLCQKVAEKRTDRATVLSQINVPTADVTAVLPELVRQMNTDAASVKANTVTNSLQEAAVKTRMQPIEHVFNKFPRTVRDVAVACGREVQLVIDGADTELDRTLIESIRDPLTHLVRNAVDHGIEPPEVRVARGKPAAGRLALRAYHESGQVTVEIRDDGGGIPVDVVRKKAVAYWLKSIRC
jgi:chemotaxis protein histidine kinase CheA